MLMPCQTHVTSFERDLTLEGDEQFVQFLSSNVSRAMVSLTDGKDRINSWKSVPVPLEAVEIDRVARQYLHIKSRHVVRWYNDDGLE